MFSREESIRKTFEIFKPDGVIEVRAVDPLPFSGYFKDREKLISSLKKHDDQTWYFTLNTIDGACYSREQCEKILRCSKKTKTTSDKEITRLKWILIDADPVRAAGVSSSKDEKLKAAKTIKRVYDYLNQVGFSDPVTADSGNGYHLVYPIDLPTKASSEIQKFLQALDMLFSDDDVKIDTSVFNPSRITKVYGTIARKGANTEERPHRASGILRIPDNIKPNPLDLIKKVSSKLPKPEKRSYSSTNIQSNFNIDDFIQNHGIAVERDTETNGRRKIVLERCPFDENHRAPDAAFFVEASGAIGFNCFHNSCQDKSWKDVRLLFEPGCYDKPERTKTKAKESATKKTANDNQSDLIKDNANYNVNDYTYDDFDDLTVFRLILSISDPADKGIAKTRFQKRASEVGYRDFKSNLKLFEDRLKPKIVPTKKDTTDLEIPLELDTGEWTVDSGGVWKFGGGIGNNVIVACSHPIAPVQRVKSIDTGDMKYRIWFQRGIGKSRTESRFLIDASVMSSPQEIVKAMTPKGISVTGGDRARALVDFLRDISDINYDSIDEIKSVSRMGWNADGFSPYVSNVEFDSATAFNSIYKAISTTGDFDKWLSEARNARVYSTTAKIVLAASFAAPLIEPLGILPFFVHLWSTASGTGKSVGQMLGASVWANPTPGGAFFPTFRSTSVGFEMMAGFLHSMPLFIDELQLAKDKSGKVQFNVYELASGSGKLRSNRSLGLNYIPKWDICFITSGETPIVKDTDGEGALNRVLEIECYADSKIIRDGHRTANMLKANYGWAGKMFIEKLMEDADPEKIIESVKAKVSPIYEDFYAQCTSSDTTEKQAMAAAVILTADKLATEWIIRDGNALTLDEIGEYLKTKERVSLMERGYDIICDWIAVNANRLHGYQSNDSNAVYGLVENGMAYIIRSTFNQICVENAIEPQSLLSHLRSKHLIETGKKGFTKTKRFGPKSDQLCNCVWLKLPKYKEEEEKNEDIPELPF